MPSIRIPPVVFLFRTSQGLTTSVVEEELPSKFRVKKSREADYISSAPISQENVSARVHGKRTFLVLNLKAKTEARYPQLLVAVFVVDSRRPVPPPSAPSRSSGLRAPPRGAGVTSSSGDTAKFNEFAQLGVDPKAPDDADEPSAPVSLECETLENARGCALNHNAKEG